MNASAKKIGLRTRKLEHKRKCDKKISNLMEKEGGKKK